MSFLPILNNPAAAFADDHHGDVSTFTWRNLAKRSKRRSPTMPPSLPFTFKVDEMTAAQGLVLLAQNGCRSDSTPSSFPDLRSAKVQTYRRRRRRPTTVHPTVENECYKDEICGMGFSTHQALGGHKSFHRFEPPAASDGWSLATSASGRRLIYQCGVCGKCFPTGQALGGHKRKHYQGVIVRNPAAPKNSENSSGQTSFPHDGALRRTLDLNLPPPAELTI